MVGLGSKERSLGQAAIAKINSNIKNSAFELKRLIGRRWNESDLQVFARSICRFVSFG
jgi:molecular chaperone DnaK (HSP70)